MTRNVANALVRVAHIENLLSERVKQLYGFRWLYNAGPKRFRRDAKCAERWRQQLSSKAKTSAYQFGIEAENWMRELFKLDAINFDGEDVSLEARKHVRVLRREAVLQVKRCNEEFDRFRNKCLQQSELVAKCLVSPAPVQAVATNSSSSDDEMKDPEAEPPLPSHVLPAAVPMPESSTRGDDESKEIAASLPAAERKDEENMTDVASLSDERKDGELLPTTPPTPAAAKGKQHWAHELGAERRVEPRFRRSSTRSGLRVFASVPGVDPRSIQLEVSGRNLTVRGVCVVSEPVVRNAVAFHPLFGYYSRPVQEYHDGYRWFEHTFDLSRGDFRDLALQQRDSYDGATAPQCRVTDDDVLIVDIPASRESFVARVPTQPRCGGLGRVSSQRPARFAAPHVERGPSLLQSFLLPF